MASIWREVVVPVITVCFAVAVASAAIYWIMLIAQESRRDLDNSTEVETVPPETTPAEPEIQPSVFRQPGGVRIIFDDAAQTPTGYTEALD